MLAAGTSLCDFLRMPTSSRCCQAPEDAIEQLDMLDAVERGECKDMLPHTFTRATPDHTEWHVLFVRRDGPHFLLVDSEFADARVVMTAVVSEHNRFLLSRYKGFPSLVGKEMHAAMTEPLSTSTRPRRCQQRPAPLKLQSTNVAAGKSALPSRVRDRCCAVLDGGQCGRMWQLFSTHCEMCDGALCKYSCARYEASPAAAPTLRQCLGRFTHKAVSLPDFPGRVHQLHVSIPATNKLTGRPCVWCPRQRRQRMDWRKARGGDGSAPRRPSSADSSRSGGHTEEDTDSDGSTSADELVGEVVLRSRLPVYIKAEQLLALSFPVRRRLLHSTNNFLLEGGAPRPCQPSASKDAHARSGTTPSHLRKVPKAPLHLQFGRVEENLYLLMFNNPLSVVQAFGVALSTFSWS